MSSPIDLPTVRMIACKPTHCDGCFEVIPAGRAFTARRRDYGNGQPVMLALCPTCEMECRIDDARHAAGEDT